MIMIDKSKTFINKRGIIPELSYQVKLSEPVVIAARVYVAKHSRSTEEMTHFFHMLGLV